MPNAKDHMELKFDKGQSETAMSLSEVSISLHPSFSISHLHFIIFPIPPSMTPFFISLLLLQHLDSVYSPLLHSHPPVFSCCVLFSFILLLPFFISSPYFNLSCPSLLHPFPQTFPALTFFSSSLLYTFSLLLPSIPIFLLC